jgi:uncharacterized protein (DUF2235 family)
MALYAFDGTGNEDRDGTDYDSNVLDFFRAYDDPLKNDDAGKERGSLYLKGIGTRGRTLVGELKSEAFGIGGHRRVRQAMDRLENNIEAGDTVVDLIGFSRGAALALSFGNDVARKLPKTTIRFVGLFDVVGQFGVPGEHINAGHDLGLPTCAGCCYHAMALDESRALFPLTRLGRGFDSKSSLREVWFRGVHSDVGGGNGNRGLNWIALNWMFENALRHGLPILPAAVAANLADKDLPQRISRNSLDLRIRRTVRANDLLHAAVQLIAGEPDRPHNNPRRKLARIDDAGTIIG